MKRTHRIALASALLAGGLAAAGSAAARDVYWSIGIQAPIHPAGSIGTVVSNAPVWAPAPVWVVDAPVYVAPPPVVYVPRPVYVAPRVVYRPAPYPVYAPYGVAKIKYKRGKPRWRDHDDD